MVIGHEYYVNQSLGEGWKVLDCRDFESESRVELVDL